jgi:hypothetical protein
MSPSLKVFISIAALCLSALPLVANSQSYSPEQTSEMWLSALKRNDANAMALLGSTPEQYLRITEQAKADCGDENSTLFLSDIHQADAKDHYFNLVQPYLEIANQSRDEYAQLAQAVLEDIDTETRLSIEQQQAAQEVGFALLAWAKRTDFSSEARLRNAIGILIDESRSFVATPATCKQINASHPLKRADHLVRLVKGLFKAYDFDIDKILSTIEVSAQGQYLDKENVQRAKIRISYQVFEARGFVIVEMKRVDDQWFFTENLL